MISRNQDIMRYQGFAGRRQRGLVEIIMKLICPPFCFFHTLSAISQLCLKKRHGATKSKICTNHTAGAMQNGSTEGSHRLKKAEFYEIIL